MHALSAFRQCTSSREPLFVIHYMHDCYESHAARGIDKAFRDQWAKPFLDWGYESILCLAPISGSACFPSRTGVCMYSESILFRRSFAICRSSAVKLSPGRTPSTTVLVQRPLTDGSRRGLNLLTQNQIGEAEMSGHGNPPWPSINMGVNRHWNGIRATPL